MLREVGSAFALVGLVLLLGGPTRADESLSPLHERGDYVVDGVVLSVSSHDDRLTVAGDDSRRYVVDSYGADVTLADSRLGETSDLLRGMRVHVVGTLLGRNLLEADRLRVAPEVQSAPAVLFAEPTPAPAPPVPAAAPQVILDGLIRDVDASHNDITFLGDDDKRYTADTNDTDIILPGTEHAGQTSDLTHGMRIHLIGVSLSDGKLEADRIRVLPAAATPAPVAPTVPVAENMDAYTGILIDARSLPTISRSPAPAIYGTAPDASLLYPDRSHVPTPDEVQDESIVRYYWTVDAASSGVAGSNPLILTAQAVLGPAQDAVQLTPEDAARFQLLDKRLHFTRTWKVGFLVPADH